MYNDQFCCNSKSVIFFRTLKCNRTCISCGKKIKKGTPVLIQGRYTDRARIVICPDCGAEFYFRATTRQIPVSEEDIKRGEQEVQALIEKSKQSFEKEQNQVLEQRIESIMKDYSTERILKLVLLKSKRKRNV